MGGKLWLVLMVAPRSSIPGSLEAAAGLRVPSSPGWPLTIYPLGVSSRPEPPGAGAELGRRHTGAALCLGTQGGGTLLAALCVRRPAWALLACGGAISEGKSASPLGRGTEREA